jgi:hypothetical protein
MSPTNRADFATYLAERHSTDGHHPGWSMCFLVHQFLPCGPHAEILKENRVYAANFDLMLMNKLSSDFLMFFSFKFFKNK